MHAAPSIMLLAMISLLIGAGTFVVVVKNRSSSVGLLVFGILIAISFLIGIGTYNSHQARTYTHSYTSIIEKDSQQQATNKVNAVLKEAAEKVEQKLNDLDYKIKQGESSGNEKHGQPDEAVTMGKEIDSILNEIKEKHAAQLKEKSRLEALKKQLEKQLDGKTKELSGKIPEENLTIKNEGSGNTELPKWLQARVVIEQKNLSLFLQNPMSIPDEFAVSSGRFITKQEATAEAEKLAKQVVEVALARKYDGVNLPFLISTNQLHNIIRKTNIASDEVEILDGSLTTMHRKHLLVRLDGAILDSTSSSLRQALVMDRIRISAAVLFAVMLLSFIVSFYFSPATDQKKSIE